MTNEVRLRKLSTIEASMAHMHAHLCGNGQVTTLLTLKGCFAKERLNAAVLRLFHRFQVLGCFIREESDELFFYSHNDFSRIEPEFVVLATPAEPDRLIEEEVNGVLDSSQVLCRFRIVEVMATGRTHVLFTRHHAISDAFTTERMCGEFLRYLGEESGEPDADDAAQGLIEIGMGADAWAAQNGSIMNSAKPPRGIAAPIPHVCKVPLSERQSGVVSHILEPELTERVIGYAKQNDVTINSLVSAALSRAVCNVLERHEVELFSAVSLRKRLVEGRIVDEPGCYISVQNGTVCPGDLPLASLAQTVGDDLRRAIGDNPPVPAPHEAIRTRIEGMGRAHMFFGVGITNMGKIELAGSTSGIQVEDFRSAVNRSGGLALLVLHISSFQGRLYFVFTYPLQLASNETINQVVAQLTATLAAL